MTDWKYDTLHDCEPCRGIYDDEPEQVEPARDPSPEQLADAGRATLDRIHAIATEPTH